MGDVTDFPGLRYDREEPEAILEKAKGWDLEDCVVIGVRDDGEIMVGGNTSDPQLIVYLLAVAQKEVLDLGRREYDA